MQQVSETIPEELVPRVEAAVAWFNSSPESAGETFRATGILDADDALQGSDKLQLILCGGNRCEQHSFLVKNLAEKWSIDFFGNDTSQRGEQAQADLDPPPGARLNWLNNKLAQHEFVLLLFYRGFW